MIFFLQIPIDWVRKFDSLPDFLIRRWRAAFHSYFHSPQLFFSSPYPHSILSVLCPLLLLRSQSVKFHCVLLQRVDHESLWEESGKNQSSTLPFLARTKASPCSLSPLSGFPPSFSLHSTPLFPLNRLSTNEELVGLGGDDKASSNLAHHWCPDPGNWWMELWWILRIGGKYSSTLGI